MLLNCHTYYSFGYGTLNPKELMQRAQKAGYSSIAITDINNTSALLDSIRICSEYQMRVIAGVDFRNGIRQQFVALAQNNEGFQTINQYLSEHLHQTQPFDELAPDWNNVYVIYPFHAYKGHSLKPHEFIGIAPSDLPHLRFSKHLLPQHKLVIHYQVSFGNKLQFNAHRLLRAIKNNTLLSKLPLQEQASGNEYMIAQQQLLHLYAAFPHIIANTQQIMNTCSIGFEYGKLANKNLRFYTNSLREDMALLYKECEAGLAYRYPGKPQHVLDRIQKELSVIEQKDFASYFLINWDIITYARHKNYYYVGRGSGANSIIAYLLRITDVDPIELDLYFERFINIYRSNAPDFDIDFSWTDRDDITDYIFKRFNTQHNVALLGAYNTYQNDAIIRELGKVFGLPAGEIERIQKTKKHTDSLSELVLKYSEVLHGYPSHLSIHASGILISDKPITTYSATHLPPKGYPTTQFSMLEAEDIGLFKFDILSQRGLGKIKDALAIIKQNHGVDIDIHNIKKFTKDESVKTLLREGKAIGCFYVESPGMRMLLAKLRADDYLRLVAASSIIRPGVSQSGMMRTYIDRYRNLKLREEAKKKLPELYDILSETYGVMVYQEDVIKVAHQFANLTLAEADYLRRGMSWKFKQRNEFHVVKQNFFNNCLAKGHDLNVVTDIWNQIESFANFAFSKGHSASYAVESYQALYLKAHFPLEYMVATLNNGGGFYRTELYVHEARMHGAQIQLPCINHSNNETVIRGRTIYLGLASIAELNEHTRSLILHHRNSDGPFENIEDFINRVPVSIEQLRLLIRVGAFSFTGKNKKELLWQAHMLIHPIKAPVVNALFTPANKTFTLPKLHDTAIENAFDEMDLLGFTLSSPFELLRNSIPSKLTARELPTHINRTVHIVGYLVNTKRTYTSKGQSMYFGTFIDTEGHWIDTVHFPESARQYPFTGNGCYHIVGKVTVEYDFMSIEVSAMKRLPYIDRETITAHTLQ